MTPLHLVTLIKVSSQYVQNLKILNFAALTGSDRQQCNLHSIFLLQVNTKSTQLFIIYYFCLISLRFDFYSSNDMNAPPRKVFWVFFFKWIRAEKNVGDYPFTVMDYLSHATFEPLRYIVYVRLTKGNQSYGLENGQQ